MVIFRFRFNSDSTVKLTRVPLIRHAKVHDDRYASAGTHAVLHGRLVVAQDAEETHEVALQVVEAAQIDGAGIGWRPSVAPRSPPQHHPRQEEVEQAQEICEIGNVVSERSIVSHSIVSQTLFMRCGAPSKLIAISFQSQFCLSHWTTTDERGALRVHIRKRRKIALTY